MTTPRKDGPAGRATTCAECGLTGPSIGSGLSFYGHDERDPEASGLVTRWYRSDCFFRTKWDGGREKGSADNLKVQRQAGVAEPGG